MFELNRRLVTAMSMSLEGFPNDELAAMNNAVTVFGMLSKGNIAFDRAVKLSLCDDAGRVSGLEELIAAASMEINRRLDAGTFQ